MRFASSLMKFWGEDVQRKRSDVQCCYSGPKAKLSLRRRFLMRYENRAVQDAVLEIRPSRTAFSHFPSCTSSDSMRAPEVSLVRMNPGEAIETRRAA